MVTFGLNRTRNIIKIEYNRPRGQRCQPQNVEKKFQVLQLNFIRVSLLDLDLIWGASRLFITIRQEPRAPAQKLSPAASYGLLGYDGRVRVSAYYH